MQAAKADTPAWMKTFLNIFFSTGSERDASVSDEAFQANWNLATVASARSAYIMRHAARKDWKHRIRAIKSERYSLTLRSLDSA